jgi:hypothetical protein
MRMDKAIVIMKMILRGTRHIDRRTNPGAPEAPEVAVGVEGLQTLPAEAEVEAATEEVTIIPTTITTETKTKTSLLRLGV